MSVTIAWAAVGLLLGMQHARVLWVQAWNGGRLSRIVLRWLFIIALFGLAVRARQWATVFVWGIGFVASAMHYASGRGCAHDPADLR
jgi:hypothetical protein